MNNTDLYNEAKRNYQTYVKNLIIDRKIRNILLSDFIESNPRFYLYYPNLFCDEKKPYHDEEIKLVSIAGYLFYQSILILDKIIDEGSPSSNFILVNVSQEECIKLLTSVFGLQSKFWNLWNKNRSSYFQSIALEKKLKNEFRFDLYEKVASTKASFGKSAIDAVALIENCVGTDRHLALLQSHDYFSIAYQINDDILDFKIDSKFGQFNLAYHELKKKYNGIDELTYLNKKLYLDGIASMLFQKAVEYLDKSLGCISNINVPLWKSEILEFRQKLEASIFEIGNYIEVINAESREIIPLKDKLSIQEHLSIGIEYLKESQSEDGSWHEFYNQAGVSNVWSTGFIISELLNSSIKNCMANKIQRGLSYLNEIKHENGWGYNQFWINDADTSNFALICLRQYNPNIQLGSMIKQWVKYYDPIEGSFSTYTNSEELIHSLNDKTIQNVDGWISSHACVSAVALFFLSILNENHEQISQLTNYLTRLEDNGKMEAYWWTSNIYIYYYWCKACVNLKNSNLSKRLIKKVSEMQNSDGSFSDPYGKSIFYTGLACKILMNDYHNYSVRIENAVSWLLSKQNADGSWISSYPMQIPDPSVKRTTLVNLPISNKGYNVRAKEFNGLFSSVAALTAIYEYEQKTT